MRAAVFERQGLDNLNVKEDVQEPTIADYDVLIKVKAAGVNPIDYPTVSNIPGIKPLPHIPGVEITGVIEKVGNHVTLPLSTDIHCLYPQRLYAGVSGRKKICKWKYLLLYLRHQFSSYLAKRRLHSCNF
jgi:NADPH:quinone reductase-like Zn-dependent oxidoreductase